MSSSLSSLSAAETTSFPDITAIKRAIPPHCFRPTVIRSMFHVGKDLLFIVGLYAVLIVAQAANINVYYISLPVYWFLQGTLFWAVFVLGHDCGHGSFSNYSALNDLIGTLLHTVILVPYYPWKLSHRHHHKNTGNIDRDEIFYPVREADHGRCNDIRFAPYFALGFGWFYYLIKGYLPRAVPHFNPFGSFFQGHALHCGLSIASLLLWTTMLLLYIHWHSFADFVCHYLIPVYVFASWLVVVTFLHHNEDYIPWYADSEWSYVKGQLSSVDRHYGWAHRLTHYIGVHQIHHLFPRIPHYYLEEATTHFRKQFPGCINTNNDPIVPAFIRMFKTFMQQRHIDNKQRVHFYKRQ